MKHATRTRWNSSRPIVCQADMDDALATMEMIERDLAELLRHPLEIQGAKMILKQVKARIAEREANSI